MNRIIAITSALLMVLSCNKEESMEYMYARVIETASTQAEQMYHSLEEGQFPRTVKDGRLETTDRFWWCSGFFPGYLWYVYEATGNYIYYQYADQFTNSLDTLKTCAGSHDIGFQMNCSYGNALRITRNERFKEPLVTSAYYLADRFNPEVGCTRSWNSGPDEFKVIVDNMMNLELLMSVSRLNGDPKLAEIAVTHANTTMKNHFREDGSSWHLVIYNPQDGSVIKKQTVQGYSDDSAWARGQAWGLYGFTMMYRFTKDPAYLERACSIADYIISRLPEDCIPYWDYDSPSIPDDVRDASAAAIQASALVELSTFVGKKESRKYLSVAEKTLRELSSDTYLAEGNDNCGFLLKHSTGHKPGNSEVDVPLSYADYYFLEAFIRFMKLKSGVAF